MAKCLHKRLMSERGAFLSYALFLALICAAVSSLVLAAATASMNHMNGLGEFDQRYYSVSSAAALFQDELKKDGQVSYTFVEQSTGMDVSQTGAQDSFNNFKITSYPEVEGKTDKLYFLYDVTKYALYGPTGSCVEGAYSNTWWNQSFLDAKPYKAFTYTIEPSSDLAGSLLPVQVEARLYDNWTVDVVMSDKGSDTQKQFSTYLSFVGTLQESNTITGGSSVLARTGGPDSSANSLNTALGTASAATVTQTHTSTVTWRLKQVVPGRGFDRD